MEPGRDTRPLFAFFDVVVEGRLDAVTGTVPDGGVTVLVGPSGSGKSTILRLCNRLEVPDRGRVELEGVDVMALDVLALRRRVGMVFQRPTPFGASVLENLRVAVPGLSEREASDALDRVRLGPRLLGRDARELSGGEAQRVCLARTLVTRPHVVLMDEVTSSVDPSTTREIESLARELADDGVSILWVTHDLEQVRRIADYVVVVLEGRIAAEAPPEALAADGSEAVRRFLGGRS